MDPARIADLLNPFLTASDSAALADGKHATPEPGSLTVPQLQKISTYIDILMRWNTRINLTATRNPEEIVTRHFGESLFAARHLFPSVSGSTAAAVSPDYVGTAASAVPPSFSSASTHRFDDVLDLGSGAGFPGIPIKIWNPGIQLTLIESNQKKATFLREITRAITLTDVNVFTGRAQDFLARQANSSPAHTPSSSADPALHYKAAVVTLRAVERFNSILPVAANLVAPGGRLAMLVGRAQVASAHGILPTFEWSDPLKFPLSNNRVFLIGSPKQ